MTTNVRHVALEQGAYIDPTARVEGTRLEMGEYARIADDTWIGGAACWQDHSGLWLGAGSVIQSRCIVNTGESVRIGEDTALSIGVQVYTHHHWQSVLDGYLAAHAPVVIGSNVHIGANAVIMPGTTIGDGALIGANSVVSGIIPERALVEHGKVVRIIPVPDRAHRRAVAAHLVLRFKHDHPAIDVPIVTPTVWCVPDDTVFDLEAGTVTGPATPDAKVAANWLRRRGIRFKPRSWGREC